MGGSGQRKPIGAEARRRFLAALIAGASLDSAARSGGHSLSSFYKQRRSEPDFAVDWKAALDESATRERALIRPNNKRRLQSRRMRRVAFDEGRQETFLNHFAGCCDTREAAEVAGVHPTTVYKHCRKNPDFAAEFMNALDLGYVQLRVESVRQRLEAQKRLREAVEEGIPTGEVAEEFERVLKLLDRWDRGNGRAGMRTVSPERRRALSFDESLELLERKLRHLDIPIVELPPAIARRYDGEEGGGAGQGGAEEGQ